MNDDVMVPDCPMHPYGEWSNEEAEVIREWGRERVAEAVCDIEDELRTSQRSERDAWRDRYELQDEVKRLRRVANAAAVPDGWAILTKKGEAVEFRGRVREFFGQMLVDEGRMPDAQHLAKRDDDHPRDAPHRLVPVFFGVPPPLSQHGLSCSLCANEPSNGWFLYCTQCIDTRLSKVVQGGTA